MIESPDVFLMKIKVVGTPISTKKYKKTSEENK